MLYVARRLPDGSVLRSRRLGGAAARGGAAPTSGRCARRSLPAASLLFLIGAAASRRFSEPIARADARGLGDRRRRLRAETCPAPAARRCSCWGGAPAHEGRRSTRAVERAEGGATPGRDGLRDGCRTASSSSTRSCTSSSRTSASRGMIGRARAGGARRSTTCCGTARCYECFETTVQDTGDRRGARCGWPTTVIWQVAVVRRCRRDRGPPRSASCATSRVLERTESMRRTFVADVSHELRTPIASIAAAAETLAEGGADKAETAELLGLIRRQSDRMRELIDDLMDLAQIESGAVPLERQDDSASTSCCRRSPRTSRPAAREQARRRSRSGRRPGGPVVGDRRRLGQLTRNLIDNAIKFSPAGAPVVIRSLRDGTARGFSVVGPRARNPARPSATRSSSASTRSTGRARRPGPARGWVSRSSSTSLSSTAPPSRSRARSARGSDFPRPLSGRRGLKSSSRPA